MPSLSRDLAPSSSFKSCRNIPFCAPGSQPSISLRGGQVLISTIDFEFMNPARIGALIRSLARYSLQKRASFSSYAVANPRFSNSFFDGTDEGSAVYQTKLKTQRPTTINRWSRPDNSVSFIGTVVWPLSVQRTNNGRLAVKTLLNVKNPRESNSTFSIKLVMREEMAEMCIQHLKQNDFIYVSGHLLSYTKADEDGKRGVYYQVDVKELNYVQHHGQRSASEKSKDLEIQEGEARIERYRDKLHLWQVFLHNPSEWWDNRKNKRSPQQPDFKHKDTGEVLWLSPNDPPWIKKQLELLDSRMGEALGEQVYCLDSDKLKQPYFGIGQIQRLVGGIMVISLVNEPPHWGDKL